MSSPVPCPVQGLRNKYILSQKLHCGFCTEVNTGRAFPRLWEVHREGVADAPWWAGSRL